MTGFTYPLLIQNMLLSGAARAENTEIISDGLMRYDYAELVRRIRRLSSAVHRLGAAHGDTIAVMDWDTHRYLEAFFGIPAAGTILQMVNVRMSPEQVIYTLNKTGAKIIFCNAEFAPLLKGILPHLEHAEKLICMDDAAVSDDEGFWHGGYEALLQSGDPEADFPDLDENDEATVFFTTGTTGLPKGVHFSHRQLVLHTLSLLAGFAMTGPHSRFSSAGVYMPMTPMFHVHAWGFPYAATLAGMKQVYPGRYIPTSLLRLIDEEGVTISHCVPTIMRMLLDDPQSADIDLSRLVVVIGGSALPEALAEQSMERGIDMFAGYGMSESCPILSTSTTRFEGMSKQEEIQRRCLAGVAAPLVDMRIADPDMNFLPRDGESTGEVVVRAPWLTPDYLGNEEASEALWAGGWMHTGDVGKIEPNGYLSITDRLKDVIKSGGEWISSLDMENIISRHPQVGEVAVIGVPDKQWGERALPFIVSRTGDDIALEELAKLVSESINKGELPRYAALQDARFLDEIPKTSVGKLDKKALRAMV